MNKGEILELAERVEGLDGNDPTVDELTLLAGTIRSGCKMSGSPGFGRSGGGWWRL